MRRRRRRNNGIWFPTLGTVYNNGANHYHNTSLRLGTIQPQIDSSSAAISGADLQVVPLVSDYTIQPDDAIGLTSQSLRDLVEGQDYFIDRIVGKLHLECSDGAAGTHSVVWANVLVKCGIFVARSIDEAQQNVDLQTSELDPLEVNNVQDPWIWQRSWMFSNQAASGTRLAWPTANSSYGSVMDGPHIDIRTKRRVTREHRLWFVMTARGYDIGATVVTGTQIQQPNIGGVFDYRIHGAMRKAKQNREF